VVLSRFFRRGQRDQKLEQSLQKTRRGVFRQVIEIFQRSEIDEDFYDDLETVLIGADIGADTTDLLMDELRAQIRDLVMHEHAEQEKQVAATAH
jgi:fused signal recognition particle receptor